MRKATNTAHHHRHPPAARGGGRETSIGFSLVISITLTLLFYLPGLIHALLVVFKK